MHTGDIHTRQWHSPCQVFAKALALLFEGEFPSVIDDKLRERIALIGATVDLFGGSPEGSMKLTSAGTR